MSTNIAINGMGRIGRMVLRIALQNKNLNVVAISTSYPSRENNCTFNQLRYNLHGEYNLKWNRLKMVSRLEITKLNWLTGRNPENMPSEKIGMSILL